MVISHTCTVMTMTATLTFTVLITVIVTVVQLDCKVTKTAIIHVATVCVITAEITAKQGSMGLP